MNRMGEMGRSRSTVSLLVAVALTATEAGLVHGQRPLPDPTYEQVLAPEATGDGLPVGRPADVQLRTPNLRALLDWMRADEARDLRSVLIWRQQRLVFEAYLNGASRDDLHDIRSAAKSITGTLVGLALSDGAVGGLDESVLEYLPLSPEQTRQAEHLASIRIRDLLEMRSGLDSLDTDPNSAGNEAKLDRARDWLAFASTVPLTAAPGTKWAYSSLNTMLLGRIVEATTREDLQVYLDRKLFGPLGITNYRWRRSPDGHPVGQGNLALRARDALKFGILFLQKGHWQGRDVVPEAWVSEATIMRFPVSGPDRIGYGYLWWHGRETSAGVPVSFYFASGNGGQKIAILDSLDMVIVINSLAYGQARGHQRSHDIIRRILDAVERSSVAPSNR